MKKPSVSSEIFLDEIGVTSPLSMRVGTILFRTNNVLHRSQYSVSLSQTVSNLV